MNKKTKSLVAKCISDLLENKVAINMPMSKKVIFSDDGDEMFSNGYFSDEPREFAVAMKKPQKDWLPIFLHEYSHFRQWKDKAIVWKETDVNCMDSWLTGVDFSEKTVDRSIFGLRNLELDCEIRTVALIQEHDIKMDIDLFIKQANAYLLFYNIVRTHRVWYKIAPYEVKEIIDLMPPTFLEDYGQTPKEYVALVMEHCF